MATRPKPKPLADNFRRLREAAGLTQAQVADSVGVHLQTIYLIERGEQDNPRLSTLAAAAKLFGVTLDQLTTRAA